MDNLVKFTGGGQNGLTFTESNNSVTKTIEFKTATVGTTYLVCIYGINPGTSGGVDVGVKSNTNCTLTLKKGLQTYTGSGFEFTYIYYLVPTSKNGSFTWSAGQFTPANKLKGIMG